MSERLTWSPDEARQSAEVAAELARVSAWAEKRGVDKERARCVALLKRFRSDGNGNASGLLADIESGKDPSR